MVWSGLHPSRLQSTAPRSLSLSIAWTTIWPSGLSSASRIRKSASCDDLGSALLSDLPSGIALLAVGSCSRGRNRRNEEPSPNVLWHSILPRKSPTRREEIVRPRPVPPNLRWIELSPWLKFSKSSGSVLPGCSQSFGSRPGWFRGCFRWYRSVRNHRTLPVKWTNYNDADHLRERRTLLLTLDEWHPSLPALPYEWEFKNRGKVERSVHFVAEFTIAGGSGDHHAHH